MDSYKSIVIIASDIYHLMCDIEANVADKLSFLFFVYFGWHS